MTKGPASLGIQPETSFLSEWNKEHRMLIYEVLRRVSIQFTFLSLRFDSKVQMFFPHFFVKLCFLLLCKDKPTLFFSVLFSPGNYPRLWFHRT